jgi:hypothetical protein
MSLLDYRILPFLVNENVHGHGIIVIVALFFLYRYGSWFECKASRLYLRLLGSMSLWLWLDRRLLRIPMDRLRSEVRGSRASYVVRLRCSS